MTRKDIHRSRQGPRRPHRRLGSLAAAALLAAMALGVQAQDASQRLRARSLAATCAHCHGTDGRPVQGEAMVQLAGRPAGELLATLLDFRTGQRPATIMHQITRGYSQEQLEAVANYFAAQK